MLLILLIVTNIKILYYVFMKVRYLVPLVLWSMGIINFFQPFNGFLFYFSTFIFWLLLISHLVECIVLRRRILSSSDAPIKAFTMTFLFGVIYLVSMEQSSDLQTI